MVEREVFGNGFIRFVAAPDMNGAQVVYVFASDGRCIVTLHAPDIVALANAFADVADDAGELGPDVAERIAAEQARALEQAHEIIEAAAATLAARRLTLDTRARGDVLRADDALRLKGG